MSYPVGQPIYQTIEMLDDANVAITGLVAADFAIFTAVKLPSGSPAVALALTEIGGGLYSVSFTPSTVGTWATHVQYVGPPLRDFTNTEDLVVGASAGVTGVAASGGATTTLSELRRSVAEEFGDFLELIATGADADNTVIDENRIVLADKAYAGSQAYVKSGTALNVGETRFVVGSSTSAHSIQVNPEFPAITQAGDVIWLFNLRGKGFRVNEIDRAINRAIRHARSYTTLELIAVLVDPFDKADPVMTVPDYFTGIASVEYEDADGLWQEIRRSPSPSGNGWFLLPGRILRILGTEQCPVDGMTVRLHGEGLPLELAADDDETTIGGEWLIFQACAYLARTGMERLPNRGDRERLFQWYEQMAETLLHTIHNVPMVNATRVI